MGTNVSTDNKNYVTQYAGAWTNKPNDPVYLKDKNYPGVAAHTNSSAQIANPAGTVYDHGTKVAHRYSALDVGRHAPAVSPSGGLITSIWNGVNIFITYQKNVYVESANVVMHLVKTGTAAVWALLPPAVKQAIDNAQKIMGGLTPADFGGAAKEEVEELMAYLKSTEALKDTAITIGMVAAQGIPVVGQLVGGAAAVQRVSGVIDAAKGAGDELKAMGERWSKPMSPEQIAEERKKLAKFLLNVGITALMAALGKIKGKLSKKSAGKENDTVPVEVGNAAGKGAPSQCPCATNKPVIIATGEKTLSHTDFTLGGPLSVAWQRRYRSADARTYGWFGQGWSHALATELWLQADGLSYIDVQGRAIALPRIEVGEAHFAAYEQLTLSRPRANAWVLEFTNGQRHHFERHASDHWRVNLSRIEDRNGNAVQIHYDAGDFTRDGFNPFGTPPRPRQISDSAGRRFDLAWTRQGQLESIALAGQVKPAPLARYSYATDSQDPTGQPNLATHANPANQSRSYAWANHMLIGYVLASGQRHRNDYDELTHAGRVQTSEALDDGLANHFRYRNNVTWITDALGRYSGYEFDARKDIVALQDAAGIVTRTPFDANGHPKGSVDPLGRTTSTVFDRRGNLTGVIDAAGHQTKIEYNALDLPVKLTDPMGGVWLRSYDARGNLIGSIDPLGQTTSYEVDARGNVIVITDALGKTKRLTWDRQTNLVSYTDCSGQTSTYDYDALGHLKSSTDALGQVTRYAFDLLGRLQEVQGPDGAVHRYEWDGEANLIRYTDPLGQTTHWTYNGQGDPLTRTDALGQAIAYHYDRAGRLTHLTNENGEHTTFGYDIVDRLTDEIGFDGRHQRYGYNLAGELTHLIEAGGSDLGPGKVTRFARDVLGRLIAKTHEGHDKSADAAYGYDPLGRLTQASNALSTVAFAYDPVGQLLKETQHLRLGGAATGKSPDTTEAKVYAFAHSYDPLGNRTQTVLPDGQKLNQLFYGSGHLHQINLDGKVISDFERDALHRETSRTQGQLQSEFAYDPASRLKAQRVTRQGSNPGTFTGVNMTAIASFGQAREVMTGLIERGYGYDAAGQLDRILDNQRGLNVYGYDPINRVTSAQIGIGQDWGAKTQRTDQMQMAANESFHWDAASNMLDESSAQAPSTTSDGGRSFQKVSAIRGNRLEVWQDERYSYDVHGNMVERIQGKRGSQGQTVTRLHWDAAHQLQRAEVTRGVDIEGSNGTIKAVTQSFSYGYDALGRRIHKTDAFGSTTFAWDGDRMALEERGQNRTSYLYKPDSFVPLAELHDGTLHHIHTDHLGTPLEATNDEGRITWKVTYKTWGNVITEEVTEIQQKLRFQGQYFDQETGLHYNRFRYYEPGAGRFVSQDLIGLRGGLNVFSYAPNSTGWVDPFGLAGATGSIAGPNIPGGSQSGLSTGEGGGGITNPAVKEAYEKVPPADRSLYHGNCAEADALSKAANNAGITTLENLKKMTKGAISKVWRNDKKMKPMSACPSCDHVQKQLGIKDDCGK